LSVQENDTKIQKLKEEILKKVADVTEEFKNIERKMDAEKSRNSQDSNITIDSKLKEANTALTKTTEALIAKCKEEFLNKIASCTSDVKNLEKKVDASNKTGTNAKDIEEKLKQGNDEIKKTFDLLLSKCKEDLNVKVTLAETKTQKIKEDLLAKSATNTMETKSLGIGLF